MNKNQKFDVQGHRGCRGLRSENTLPAFEHALKLGVTTLELDVIISKDNKVVVSHDPFLSHVICIDASGNKILKEHEKQYNLFEMNYSEIKKCNCGSLQNPNFQNQETQETHKPLLSDVFQLAESYSNTIKYNIETKCTPSTDGVFHPRPQEFVNLLLKVIHDFRIENKVTIQSFDVRTLQYVKNKKRIELALLIDNKLSPKENLAHLGFTPNIYSPNYKLVNFKLKRFCDINNMKLLPWTVNTKSDMKRLIELGVDGMITDYPDLLLNIIK